MQIHYHNCSGCTDSWCKTPNSDGSITECVPDVTLLNPPTEAEQWQALAFKALRFIDANVVGADLNIYQLENLRREITALNDEYRRLTGEEK